jgi:hypothetical protein
MDESTPKTVNPVAALADAWSEKRGLARGTQEWLKAREIWLDGYDAGWRQCHQDAAGIIARIAPSAA